MSNLLQDAFLSTLCKKKIKVSIFLSNGVKLEGKVCSHDKHVIFLECHQIQMIYKSAIATVVPAESVDFDAQ